MKPSKSIGLVVIGDEILLGRRHDRHLPHVIEVLAERGMHLAWCRYAGDDLDSLVAMLGETQLDDIPVLCFGGIGATPDDRTRQAAAAAFGTELELHPGAVAEIARRFGDHAYPDRVRMAELPVDCRLIPNLRNGIPGFTLYEHHFLPGFPGLARPMLEWVLDTYYPGDRERLHERSVQVRGTPESALYGLMHMLHGQYEEAKMFSLPHMDPDGYVELGFRGRGPSVDRAFADLVAELNRRNLEFVSARAV